MLSQSVATALRQEMSAGNFQPGEQLSEVKVAEQFGCSRNTLREAFTTLAAERLVERIPHRGVFIATPDAAYIRDLFAARAAIEPAAARLPMPPRLSPSPPPPSSARGAISTRKSPPLTSASTKPWWQGWVPPPWMSR